MIRRLFIALYLISASQLIYGQHSLSVEVLDSLSNESLGGVSVKLQNTNLGATTSSDGKATIDGIPKGLHTLLISFIGYTSKTIELDIPFDQEQPKKIFLSPLEEQLDEILIEATRANRSVANLPTRTEVLTEEIDEAASMEPSRIAHLITHSTGIQVQTTSASSNGAVVRIQGLQGRYTQLLQDGFPLYGGISGSLDVLQIPPLDLRQVEYIKGPASTLYGGGAIGGLINLLTKKPETEETLLHVNFSHIGARDFNAFSSRRFGKFGMTSLASFHSHDPYDADDDGYTDVPNISKFNFNPKLYFYPNDQLNVWFGVNVSTEKRMGGDVLLIANQTPNNGHFFYDKQNTSRYSTQFLLRQHFNKENSLTFKNSISIFDRFLEIRENSPGHTTRFGGRQLSNFNELNYHHTDDKQDLNLGLNVYSDHFYEDPFDAYPLRDQSSMTYGVFLNHLWDVNKKFAVESGLRADYVLARTDSSQNDGENFVLPKINALYKLNKHISLRTGGGLGYRMPSLFSEEAEPFGFKNIQMIDHSELIAERSYGSNFDVKYQTSFGSDNLLFTFNQLFFYNLIEHPLLLFSDNSGQMTYQNGDATVLSSGFESQIKFTFWKFTWFVGYTYTDAVLDSADQEIALVLTPTHSIKGDLLFVVENKWRIGWDYEYKSEQMLSTGKKSPALFTTGIVLERTIDRFVIFLNAENFTDTRQTKFESLNSLPNGTPQHTEVYAPLDGFFFNAGLKIKL